MIVSNYTILNSLHAFSLLNTCEPLIHHRVSGSVVIIYAAEIYCGCGLKIGRCCWMTKAATSIASSSVKTGSS